MRHRGVPDSALLRQLLGTEVRSGVAIGDTDLLPLQRKELIIRSAVCALGFVLAASWGTLLPLTLSVIAGWDHFARRRRSVLAASEIGLHLIAIRGQKTTLRREWKADIEARLILRPDNPEVPLELPGWVGVIHGADIERAERSIRDGGGEPVRIIKKD